MKKVLITGASGFLGSQLVKKWSPQEYEAISLREGIQVVDDINWSDFSKIIHLAGLAHQMNGAHSEKYFQINTDLTRALAIKAKKKGIKHFIFLSTIKVYGDQVTKVNLKTSVHPDEPYGESKWKAEQELMKLEDSTFIVSIIRPPLIIGPGVKGNLSRIISLARKPIPLPFGGISNRRSMVGSNNLIALIDHLIKMPKSGIFLVSDDKALSTTELIVYIRSSLGMKPMLIALPVLLRKLIWKIRPEFHKRLFGDYFVDNNSSYERLGFSNLHPIEKSIDQMVKHYINSYK